MPKKSINVTRLLSATLDLESGHPIESILAQHGMPPRVSAYDVVIRYQKNVEYHKSATTDYYKKQWADAVAYLDPVVRTIAKYLEVEL